MGEKTAILEEVRVKMTEIKDIRHNTDFFGPIFLILLVRNILRNIINSIRKG